MVYLYSQDGRMVVPFYDRELEFYDNTVTGKHEIYCGSKLMGVYKDEETCLAVIANCLSNIENGAKVYKFCKQAMAETFK